MAESKKYGNKIRVKSGTALHKDLDIENTHELRPCDFKCSYCTSRFNIHRAVLYYSTGKLAPEKVIVVVPLEQLRKEGSRVSFHWGS